MLRDSNEVASLLKIPVRTLDQWAYRRTGPPFVRVGRHRRYRDADIEQWLAAQTVTTGGTRAAT